MVDAYRDSPAPDIISTRNHFQALYGMLQTAINRFRSKSYSTRREKRIISAAALSVCTNQLVHLYISNDYEMPNYAQQYQQTACANRRQLPSVPIRSICLLRREKLSLYWWRGFVLSIPRKCIVVLSLLSSCVVAWFCLLSNNNKILCGTLQGSSLLTQASLITVPPLEILAALAPVSCTPVHRYQGTQRHDSISQESTLLLLLLDYCVETMHASHRWGLIISPVQVIIIYVTFDPHSGKSSLPCTLQRFCCPKIWQTSR